MTLFEFIILTTLYLFAFSYMSNRLYDERNSWINVFLITLLAGTIGVIIFPMIFADDIWEKLNS